MQNHIIGGGRVMQILEFLASNVTIIVNFIILLTVIIVVLNMLNSANQQRKVRKNILMTSHGVCNKTFLEKLIEKNKHLKKLASDLDVKISMCGIEITSYQIIQKAFVYALIGVGIGIFILNPLAVLLFAIIGFAIPIININDKVHEQFKQIDKQILKAIQLFLNEYQKTQNISEVLESICPKLDYPIRSEFERLLRRINSGVDFREALNEFANRLKNEWIYMFVNALIMNKENGSEIVDVLMKTLTKIANKEIVQNEKDMETFSGRMLNKLMMFTVPVAFVLVLIARPEAKDLYFHTVQGKMVINVSVILCIASFIITRMTEKL